MDVDAPLDLIRPNIPVEERVDGDAVLALFVDWLGACVDDWLRTEDTLDKGSS